MVSPRVKFTVDDYMTAPPDKRYELLDGEMILALSPTSQHQTIVGNLYAILRNYVAQRSLGRVWFAPLDVVLSHHDVAQPDVLFVSNERSGIITEANIQGAPDLVVEVLSPSTAQYDRGYKRTLYGRSGVREYWVVDPEAETIEVLTRGRRGLVAHATYNLTDTLTSPLLLPELSISVQEIFS